MSDLLHHRQTSHAIALPEPRVGPINIRPAALPPEGGADYMFIDALQKKHSKMVGFMHKPTIESNIRNGRVLIAEDTETTERLGYIIFHDKYLKREELGIVYQLNVTPGSQRALVGASLLKAAFERSAYGCKLYCCWCAQDLEANYFWESVGFVPIAFRAGSRGKAQGGRRKDQRIHIFWQRRIREGDCETPYWFPSETTGGAMREPRIVLPIPPGTHWSDAKPAILPDLPAIENLNLPAALPDRSGENRSSEDAASSPSRASRRERKARTKELAEAAKAAARPKRGLFFAPPESAESPKSEESSESTANEETTANTDERVATDRRPKKNDPKYVAAARELRDRYMEQINTAGPGSGFELPPSACGKYEVSRSLDDAPSLLQQSQSEPQRLLDAA